jgi:hypothetical protein
VPNGFRRGEVCGTAVEGTAVPFLAFRESSLFGGRRPPLAPVSARANRPASRRVYEHFLGAASLGKEGPLRCWAQVDLGDARILSDPAFAGGRAGVTQDSSIGADHEGTPAIAFTRSAGWPPRRRGTGSVVRAGLATSCGGAPRCRHDPTLSLVARHNEQRPLVRDGGRRAACVGRGPLHNFAPPLKPTQPWSITGAPVSPGATPVWPVRLRHGGVGPPHIRCGVQSVLTAVRRGRLRAELSRPAR